MIMMNNARFACTELLQEESYKIERKIDDVSSQIVPLTLKVGAMPKFCDKFKT
jgi:hypothetical protein